MALERTYTIPLRKGWLKAPRYKRAKKAVNTLREFLVRHMKSDDVRLLPELNLEIWKHGMKNPPPRVKVNVVKDDKGVVKAQLFGIKIEEKKPEEKKSVVKKIAEKVTGIAKPEAKPARVATSADQPTKSALPVAAEAQPEVKAETKPAIKPAPVQKPAPKAEKTEVKAEAKPKPAKKAEKPAA